MKLLLIGLMFISTACTVVSPGETGVVFNKFTEWLTHSENSRLGNLSRFKK